MDLGNYTGGGAGFGTTADQSMAASGTTGSVSSGFSGPSYDSTSGGDNYSNYVAASQPRTGIAAIKDYFTGGGYDYGYQPSLGRTLGGIGNLFLGMVNPVLGGLNYVRKNIGPEFDRFRQAPTLDRYLNPDKYLNQPYIIGSNPMDYQRFNPSQFGQEYNYQRPNGIAGLDISNLYVDASLRNTLDNIFNPNLNVDKALDKEEEKRQREQELLQELRMII
jgi:hypothetical protein